MNIIVAGSRSITDAAVIKAALKYIQRKWNVSSIITGGANGVDCIAASMAAQRGINVAVCEANWNYHGKSAGYIRNAFMATLADGLLAIWDGKSKGTKHMIELAKKHKLKIVIVRVNK